MKSRVLLSSISFLATLAVSSFVRAEPSSADKVMATQLYDDAEKEMGRSNYAVACSKYGESNRLDPQLGTLLHLADCLERAGKTASAWATFKDAIEIASRKNATGQVEAREKTARARAAALEPKLSRLVIVVAGRDTAGLEVRQDGQVVGPAVWGSPLPIDPGTHVLTAKAPGRKGWTQTIQVAGNAAKVEASVPMLDQEPVAVAPASTPVAPSAGPAESAPRAAPADKATPAESRSSGGSQRVVGYVVGGVGVVGLVVGTVFALKRSSALSERDGLCTGNVCNNQTEVDQVADLTDQAKRFSTLSTVSLVAGGAALVGGGVLVFTAPSSEAPPVATVRLSPWAGSSSFGAVVAGRW